MNIFDLLKKDHRMVSTLFNEIGGISETSISRKSFLFEKIKLELTIHADFEEQFLYPKLNEISSTHNLILESYEEHRLIKQLVNELDRMPKDSDEWHAKLRVLSKNVNHHASEEEDEIFPMARQVLTKDQVEDLTDSKLEIEEEKAALLSHRHGIEV